MKTRIGIDQKIAEIEEHYRGVFPYLLSESARKSAGHEDDLELTYGITWPHLTLAMLEDVAVTDDDVFVDLGCGVGHTVLVAALVCKRAFGVELLPDLHGAAVNAQRALGIENAAFFCDDLSGPDVSEATILFSYSTCFRDGLRARLAEQVASSRPGSRIITVTRPIEHPLVELVAQKQMSWGEDHKGEQAMRWVFFQRRTDE